MSTEWYVKSDNGNVEGPLSSALLKSRARQGEITPNTTVRHGADGNWVTASHVKGLFGPRHDDASVDHQQAHGEPPNAELPIETVFAPNMAEILDEAEHEAAQKQQRQAEYKSKAASPLVPCVDCEQQISRLASTCPNCGRPFTDASAPDKYPALQFIAGASKFFAVVVPILCLGGLAMVFDTKDKAGAVALVVYMIVAPLALWGTAELIRLLIGIESNTSTLRGMTPKERK